MNKSRQFLSNLFHSEKYISWEESHLNLGNFFKNSDLQKEFCKNGFVTLPKQATSLILQILSEEANKIPNKGKGAFQYSTMLKSEEENIKTHKKLSEVLREHLCDHLFNQYKLYSSTFLIKPPMNQSEMNLHQDWSFTIEKQYTAATIWIPLDDVDVDNGCVFALPSTHLIKNNFRSHTLPSSRIKRNEQLDPYIQSFPLKKGDILIFNPAVFHGSYPNQTLQNRIAFAITIMPQNAPLVYADKLNDNQIKLHYLEDTAILQQITSIVNNLPIKSSDQQIIPIKNSIISEQEILKYLNHLEKI